LAPRPNYKELQMSYWGAAVITNLLSVVPILGNDLVYFIWGNFCVENSTLNRFFSLHYLLPMILSGLILLHLSNLHQSASNNPEGFNIAEGDKLPFHPYYISKDLVGFLIAALLFSFFIFYFPNSLGHPDNNIPANPLVTPHSIVPEFYFLPFYAILRAIPNKTLGVVFMFSSILILALLGFGPKRSERSKKYQPLKNFFFFCFAANFLFLLWLGAKPVGEPYVTLAQISTVIYFSY
jgi:quinol-cytochrome oxidoreductase complex cytochrome b subunit